MEDDTIYRGLLANLNSDFGLLRDIAKAQKHVELVRGNPLLTKAEQVHARAPAFGELPWGEFKWGHPPQVMVDMGDGKHRAVEIVLIHSVAFLEETMRRLGALQGS